jgi:uncharacterized protein (DUF3820 family)
MTTAIILQNRAVCNPEAWLTRSATGSKPVFTATTFTPTEQKLLWLALDPAAAPGEIDNSAIKLVQSLRRRGATAEQIIAASCQAIFKQRRLDAARSYLITFGRYRGKAVGEVPEDYLRWVLSGECHSATPNLKLAIEIVLNQGGKR